MKISEFVNKINESSDLEVLEILEDSYIVINHKLKKKYKILISSIERTDWQNINGVLYGRESIILDGITRICGYMSKVNNWNKSKLGELKDRRKGTYQIAQ